MTGRFRHWRTLVCIQSLWSGGAIIAVLAAIAPQVVASETVEPARAADLVAARNWWESAPARNENSAGERMDFEARNQEQKTVLPQKIVERLGENLSGKTVAVWGLAFKAETDDVREAPALVMIRGLIEKNARVTAFDPQAKETAKSELHDVAEAVTFVDEMYDAIDDADVLVLMTEWKQFRQPDFDLISRKLKVKVIFDGRNIYDPQLVANHGLEYVGIGRGSGR